MLAATAERNAFCFSFWLISLIKIFSTFGGCASRPPFACGTLAAREPFLRRGTWDDPRPLPQPTADERIPANGWDPCGCLLVLCSAMTAFLIRSGRYSSEKISGRSIFLETPPSSDLTCAFISDHPCLLWTLTNWIAGILTTCSPRRIAGRIRISRFTGPGMEPLISTYGFLRTP